MLFPTVEFAAFFGIVLVLNWWLMPKPGLWKPFIIVASYVCYGWASPQLVIMLVSITLFNQFGAMLVFRYRLSYRFRYLGGRRIDRALLVFFIAGNIGVLVYAKYMGFFAGQINAALGTIGLGSSVPVITLAATVGISFYTFQGISYVVDVYRGTLEGPARTIDFFAYQAFFPHLFAGPIVRASELLPQLQRPRERDDVAIAPACCLIFVGLVKKLLVADVIGKTLVDPVYSSPEHFSWHEILFAIYGYAAQIYGDFSGYTDMAIGLAALLGFTFPVNFNRPYAANTLQDFWRRWHISLSSWLRDYLYIPLGGSRTHAGRNLFLTMLLGGLWHGANWTFIAWGGIHGGGLALERRFAKPWRALPAVLRWVVVFHVVCLAWVFFRAPDFGTALSVLGGLIPDGTPPAGLVTVPLLVLIAMGTVVQLVPPGKLDIRPRIVRALGELRPAPLGVVMAVCLTILLAVLPNLGTPGFIYFQF